jgi:methionine synthase I (cobalamin-dependent)
MGVAPETAAEALTALGVDAIGGNCGNGPDELLPVIERMRAVAPHMPLVAKPNIGIPVFVGARAEYRTTPETMAGEAASLRAAGATVIGACCGSAPAHLAAMAEALGDA